MKVQQSGEIGLHHSPTTIIGGGTIIHWYPKQNYSGGPDSRVSFIPGIHAYAQDL